MMDDTDEANGYYTLEELKEAESYLKNDDPTLVHIGNTFLDEISAKIKEMEHYGIPLMYAGELIGYDDRKELMIKTYKLKSHPFGTNPELRGVSVSSAPNLRRSDCCESCAHSDVDYDNCTCKIHTSTAKVYEPYLTNPLTTFYSDVCDDFVKRPIKIQE